MDVLVGLEGETFYEIKLQSWQILRMFEGKK